MLDEELLQLRYSSEGQLASLGVDRARSLLFLRLYSVGGHLTWEKSFEWQQENGEPSLQFLSGSKLSFLLQNTLYIFQTKKSGGVSVGSLLSEQ